MFVVSSCSSVGTAHVLVIHVWTIYCMYVCHVLGCKILCGVLLGVLAGVRR